MSKPQPLLVLVSQRLMASEDKPEIAFTCGLIELAGLANKAKPEEAAHALYELQKAMLDNEKYWAHKPGFFYMYEALMVKAAPAIDVKSLDWKIYIRNLNDVKNGEKGTFGTQPHDRERAGELLSIAATISQSKVVSLIDIKGVFRSIERHATNNPRLSETALNTTLNVISGASNEVLSTVDGRGFAALLNAATISWLSHSLNTTKKIMGIARDIARLNPGFVAEPAAVLKMNDLAIAAHEDRVPCVKEMAAQIAVEWSEVRRALLVRKTPTAQIPMPAAAPVEAKAPALV